MSVVSQSSDLSTRSSPPTWKLNDRLASLMDSIYAIAAGLGLRFVVDTVSRHNFKITGTLVGLWEGVILLHFLKKMPKSTDPYVAFGVRLFIDFLITESVSRLVLVLIWTGMGMVLADVAPAVWEDAGLRRTWRRIRRDLYTISETIPTVVFFPPSRTVRFSPSRESSVIGDADADADVQTEPPTAVPPSAATEPDTSASNFIPLASTPADHVRRRFPGAFSDTESVLSSAVGHRRLPTTLQNDPTRTSRRRSMYPARDYDSHSEASNDPDDMNVSSTTSSKSTETGEPLIDFSQITDVIPDEEEPTVQTSFQVEESVEVAAETEELIKGDITPRQRDPIYLPPTPSDSHAPYRRRFHEDERPVQSTGHIPTIPDMPEETAETGEGVEDWVEIEKPDADRPPTPPEKDPPRGTPRDQPSTSSAATADPAAQSAEGGGQQPWKRPPDTMINNENEGTTTNEANVTNEQRYSRPPPPYADHSQNHDDIYGDHEDIYGDTEVVHPGSSDTGPSKVDHAEPPPQEQIEEEQRNLEAKRRADEEQKHKEEAEHQRKADEDRKKEEEELQEQKRKEAERKQKEDEERQRKVDEEIRKKEAEERKQKEDEEERQRKVDEEIRKKEAEERKQKEEEERQRKAAEEKRKREEEFNRKEVEEREQREAEERLRMADEEKRKREQEQALQRTEEETARKRDEERNRKEAADAEEETQRKEALRLSLEAEETKAEADRLRLAEEAASAQRLREAEEFPRREQLSLETEEAERWRTETLVAERQHVEGVPAEEEQSPSEAEAERLHVEDQRTGDEFPTRSPSSGEDVPQYSTSLIQPETRETLIVDRSPEQLEDEALMETESILTEQSEIPERVRDRLQHILLLKAQMIEIETQIANLESLAEGETKDGVEQDLQARRKVLRKMKRKEIRRWEHDTPFSIQPKSTDTEDSISVDGISKPYDVKKRLQEHLEELLHPDVTFLKLTIQYMPTPKKQKNKPNKQKEAILATVHRFKLLEYIIEDDKNTVTIDVPEDNFADWLIAYRATVTGLEGDDDDDVLVEH